jgi:hypothetical protein
MSQDEETSQGIGVGQGSTIIEPTDASAARKGSKHGWQCWAPYVAVAWSLVYAFLMGYSILSGTGLPIDLTTSVYPMGPLISRLGLPLASLFVLLAGLPAAAMGFAMLRGVRGRLLRPLLITFGSLLAGVLLLLMTGLDLLVLVGYIPFTIRALIIGSASGRDILAIWVQWSVLHQLLCLVGGFFWLGATIAYARRSGEACLYCGRRDALEGWTSPERAKRWGRIAVYVAIVPPLFYAVTRFAWALGIPLGMSKEYWQNGQENGTWTSGLFLATFCLVGALLMLGLVQRWGEVFPRWIPILGGRQVPIVLGVFPAALALVVLIGGGIGIWVILPPMIAALAPYGVAGIGLIWDAFFQVGPTLLFPVWGVALAVATLGYYYRRRGPCAVCGRGAPGKAEESFASPVPTNQMP